MALIKLNQVIDCDQETVLQVIGDVKSYPDFLPWIESMRTSGHMINNGANQFQADVRIGFKIFSEAFSTKILIDSDKAASKPATVEMSLIRGPFRSLKGKWIIDPISPHQSRVFLDLSLEFSNPLLGAVFAANQEELRKNYWLCLLLERSN